MLSGSQIPDWIQLCHPSVETLLLICMFLLHISPFSGDLTIGLETSTCDRNEM